MRDRHPNESWPEYFCEVPLALDPKEIRLPFVTIGQPTVIGTFVDTIYRTKEGVYTLFVKTDDIDSFRDLVSIDDYTASPRYKYKPTNELICNKCPSNVHILTFPSLPPDTEYVMLHFPSLHAGSHCQVRNEQDFVNNTFVLGGVLDVIMGCAQFHTKACSDLRRSHPIETERGRGIVTESKIVNVLRLPESRVIAVLVQRTTLKRLDGLAAFLDGLKQGILGIESAIYLFDIDKKQLRTLHVFKNPPDQLIKFEPWLNGWNGEDLYFQTRGCAPTWEVESHGCWGAQIKFQYFKVSNQGDFQRVTTIPKVFNNGRNSPLVSWPNEINYTRISSDDNSIDVAITNSDSFHRMLELDNHGNLKQVE
jgi:hypothetical protein